VFAFGHSESFLIDLSLCQYVPLDMSVDFLMTMSFGFVMVALFYGVVEFSMRECYICVREILGQDCATN